MIPYFYVRTIERIHIGLADVFNNIYVNKYNSVQRDEVMKTVKVPCIIGQYDKNFANFIRNVQKKRNVPVPIIGLRYTNATPRRSDMPQPHYNRMLYSRATDQVLVDAQPIPHDVSFSLDIFTESWSDYGQIMENILPYFTPFRSLRIKEFQDIPDLERKVYVYMDSPTAQITDEYQRGSQRRELNESITFTCKCDMYRPRSIGNVIQYSELTFDKDNQLGTFPIKLQTFAYPSDIIEEIRQPWETVSESIIPGYSILGTYSGLREYSIPNFLELDLNEGVDFEIDASLYERNFKFIPTNEDESSGGYGTDYRHESSEYLSINDITPKKPDDSSIEDNPPRPYNSIHLSGYTDLEIGAPVRVEEATFTDAVPLPEGIIDGTTYYIKTSDGIGNYTLIYIDENSDEHDVIITSRGDAMIFIQTQWNRLLSWFGTNNGLMSKPYNFKMTLQFTDATETVFQNIYNKQVGEAGDEVFYPANSVWYIWGLNEENKLYFTVKTYGSDALSWTFQTEAAIATIDKTSTYTFEFLLYGEGNEGSHIMTIDDNTEQVLATERIPIGS